MCIFDNPLFCTEFSLISTKKSKLNFNVVLSLILEPPKNRVLKAKSLQVNFVEFSFFYVTFKIFSPFIKKKPLFNLKKVDYEYFKMAILVNDLRQIPSFSLLC